MDDVNSQNTSMPAAEQTSEHQDEENVGKGANLNVAESNSPSEAPTGAKTNQRPEKKKSFSLKDFGVGRQLGKGKFGFVHLAKVKKSGKKVALKIMWKSELEREKLVNQVKRETEIHHRLRHKNIVRLFSYFLDEQRVYLVLEYVPGGDVLTLMRSYDACRLPEPKASQIMRELIEAIAFCHRFRIVHRDIKPENILLAADGSIRLADFGWSCSQSPNALERMKRITFCGTLDYIAPEIHEGGNDKGYNERVDVWMAACVCYEMLQGTAPFYHEDVAKTQEKIKNADYLLPQDVSSEARDLVRQMLQKDPVKRLFPIRKALYHRWIYNLAPLEEQVKLKALLERERMKRGAQPQR